MTWAAIRTQLQTVVKAIEITNQELTVHDFPPETLEPGDLPAAVIYPPGRQVQRYNAALQRRTYTARIRVFVSDEDFASGCESVDDFAEEFLDAFDAAVKMNGAASLIEGPVIEEARDFEYGSLQLIGFDAVVTIYETNAATHSA